MTRRHPWLQPSPAAPDEPYDAFLVVAPDAPLIQAGQSANRVAATHTFDDYHARLAPATLRRQREGLVCFARFLAEAGIFLEAEALLHDPSAWTGVTWGLVQGFARWLLQAGYAVGTVNVRLSTVKRYAQLAAQAGAIPAEELALLTSVKGYGRKQGRNLDAARAVTRVGAKKAQPTRLSEAAMQALKQQPDTPQGRRDALLVCLLVDHGLRVGEVAELTVACLDVAAGRVQFYRRKVDETQIHKLSADTLRAATRYLALDALLPSGSLLRGSRKNGELVGQMGVRAIRERVRLLGEAVGVADLSPHDCRHAWATYWAPRVSLKQLQKAGGWASPAMPLHYAHASELANDGMA